MMPDGRKQHSTKSKEHKWHHKRHHDEERSDEENHHSKRHRDHHNPPEVDRSHRRERERRADETHNRNWIPDRRIKREPPDGDRQERREHDCRRQQNRRRQPKNPFKTSDEKYEWGKKEVKAEGGDKEEPKEKDKPNFELSGKLAEDTNVFNGIVIKYNEPSEARKPKKRWRLYPFKGDQELPFVPIHRQSAYLLGRSRAIVDIPTDHPSCSKQQAVIQFRMVDYEREDGTLGKRVRPYVIDLDSSNGTFVNNKKIDPRRYIELLEKDVLKFGYSTREYVIIHEESKDDDLDDNVVE